MTMHVDDRTLHDYLDGELEGAARGSVEEHAARCPTCARRLAALAEVRTGLDALPKTARPPADMWPGIAARLGRDADVVPLPVARADEPVGAEAPVAREARGHETGTSAAGPVASGAGETGGRATGASAGGPAAPSTGAASAGPAPVPRGSARRWGGTGPLAYAAGLVLAFAAGALTWTSVGPAERTGGGTAASPGVVTPDEPAVRGRLAAAATYEEAIADLEMLLAETRSRLDPATVRTLEESLATIDLAIAEAEGALAADPGSELIRGMLLGQQRAKYRVLSRAASALLPRT